MAFSDATVPRALATNAVASHALHLPVFTKLANKRVVLASASPRRREILEIFGLRPEIVRSTFEENLPHDQFDAANVDALGVGRSRPPAAKGMAYAVATATEKGIEVYRRLVEESPHNPPDLVISADTVVVSIAPHATGDVMSKVTSECTILEKPADKSDNLRMLVDLVAPASKSTDTKLAAADLDAAIPRCEVVTGVVVVYPSLQSPGYKVRTMAEATRVWFGDISLGHLEAYAQSGEGLDKAGGFAVQGLGGHLIRRVDGDYNNVVGFPGYAFFRMLERLIKEEDEFLAD